MSKKCVAIYESQHLFELEINWKAGSIFKPMIAILSKTFPKVITACHWTTEECWDKTIDPVMDFSSGFMNKSTDVKYRWMNKQVFQYQFPRGRSRAKKAYFMLPLLLAVVLCLFHASLNQESKVLWICLKSSQSNLRPGSHHPATVRPLWDQSWFARE